MKYIDADKLKTRLRNSIKMLQEGEPTNEITRIIGERHIETYNKLLSFIDSLQQEPRFPQYNNIVDKVFGAGNLENWEYKEAEMLVALAKEELLKSLQQEQPLTTEKVVEQCKKFGGNPEVIQQKRPEKSKKDCNSCPHCIDRKDQNGWHFKGCFGGPYKGKFIAEIDECPLKQDQPEVDLEKEIDDWYNTMGIPVTADALKETARHFAEWGATHLNIRKEK